MRRAVLRAIDRDPGADPPVLDDAVLAAVVADFTSEAQALSRALLGGGSDGSTGSGDLAAGFDGTGPMGEGLPGDGFAAEYPRTVRRGTPGCGLGVKGVPSADSGISGREA